VEEIVPIFVDPATDGPLPGREEQYNFVMSYRVLLLHEELKWAEAARLQAITVDYNRQRAAVLLEMEPWQLDSSQRNTLRSPCSCCAQYRLDRGERSAPSGVRMRYTDMRETTYFSVFGKVRFRLQRGQKHSKKKEAIVTSLYTIAPHPRTPEAVVSALLHEDSPTDAALAARPSPVGKELRATLAGKTVALERLAQRANQHEHPYQEQVALTDGSEALQQQGRRTRSA